MGKRREGEGVEEDLGEEGGCGRGAGRREGVRRKRKKAGYGRGGGKREGEGGGEEDVREEGGCGRGGGRQGL